MRKKDNIGISAQTPISMEESTTKQRIEAEKNLLRLIEQAGNINPNALGKYLLEQVEAERVVNEQLKKGSSEKKEFYQKKKFLLELENFALILTKKF